VNRRFGLKSLTVGAALGLLALLSACSSSPSKPQSPALPAVSGGLVANKVWSTRLGEITTPLQASVQGTRVVLASSQGLLLEVDALQGQEIWRLQLKDLITAGVGSDGRRHAVVTSGNELVVVQDGREIWRQKLNAQTFTAPLVAGERVFVQTGDRSVLAFDGASGQRLWALPRNADPLVVRQSGVLVAVGDALLAGNGGRLSAIQPLTGQVRWDLTVGSSRGTNEVERLVDLVAGLNRQGNSVCARSFQTSIACIDASRGAVQWTRAAQGHTGLEGDETRIYGAESDSKVQAWSRQNGQPQWTQDALRFRGVGAPLVMGRALVLGDESGLLHFLAREDGKVLQRLSTDGSAVALRPVLAGQTLVIVNRSGQISGYRTE